MRVKIPPALEVDAINAKYLDPTLFNMMTQGVDHVAVFPIEEASARGRENDYSRACMTKAEQFHLTIETVAVPFVVFALEVHFSRWSVHLLRLSANYVYLLASFYLIPPFQPIAPFELIGVQAQLSFERSDFIRHHQ
jgi:hypothetical protein